MQMKIELVIDEVAMDSDLEFFSRGRAESLGVKSNARTLVCAGLCG